MFVFRRYTVHKTEDTQFIRQLQTQKAPKGKDCLSQTSFKGIQYTPET